MKNKVLVNVYVPSIDDLFDIYVPVNESVNKVLELILKSINDLSDSSMDLSGKHYILDPETSNIYDLSLIIRDTNIKNNKKIILI